jgi:TRAP-type C4-dicarboxylate transport system permease small subunit
MVAYAAVASLLMIDVIGREIFSTSFLGAQQAAVYGAIIAGFLGLSLATSDVSHLKPEFLNFLSGAKFDKPADRIGDLISSVFFFVSSYIGWTFVAISMESGDKAPVLYFVLWPLQLVIPYAFASAGIKHLIFAIHPELKTKSKEGKL